MTMPTKFFLEWAGRSLFKATFVSLLVGILWMPFNSHLLSTTVGETSTFAPMISLVVEASVIYTVVFLSALVGLALHEWGVIAETIHAGRSHYLKGLLMSLVASQGIAVIVRVSRDELPSNGVWNASLLIVWACALAGYSYAYRMYIMFGVMTSKERKTHERSRKEGTQLKRVLRFSFTINDRTRAKLPVIPVTLIVAFMVLIYVEIGSIADLSGHVKTVALAVLGFSFALWGILIRLWDVVKPWGEQERLCHHQDHYRVHKAVESPTT